jgi:hypothetical protein
MGNSCNSWGPPILHFLTEQLPQTLEDAPLATGHIKCFTQAQVQDGFTHYVKQLLDSHNPNGWTRKTD